MSELKDVHPLDFSPSERNFPVRGNGGSTERKNRIIYGATVFQAAYPCDKLIVFKKKQVTLIGITETSRVVIFFLADSVVMVFNIICL